MNNRHPAEELPASHFLSAPTIIKIKHLIFFYITFGLGFLPWFDWILENFYPTVVQMKIYI